MHDVLQAASSGPRNLLIPGSNERMGVVDSSKCAFNVPVSVPSALRVPVASIWMVKFSPVESPEKTSVSPGEQTGQLDGIAVRPVERSGDDALLLLEHQFQSEMFDGQRPGACDRWLPRLTQANGKCGPKDESCELRSAPVQCGCDGSLLLLQGVKCPDESRGSLLHRPAAGHYRAPRLFHRRA